MELLTLLLGVVFCAPVCSFSFSFTPLAVGMDALKPPEGCISRTPGAAICDEPFFLPKRNDIAGVIAKVEKPRRVQTTYVFRQLSISQLIRL